MCVIQGVKTTLEARCGWSPRRCSHPSSRWHDRAHFQWQRISIGHRISRSTGRVERWDPLGERGDIWWTRFKHRGKNGEEETAGVATSFYMFKSLKPSDIESRGLHGEWSGETHSAERGDIWWMWFKHARTNEQESRKTHWCLSCSIGDKMCVYI